jgi:serpin B
MRQTESFGYTSGEDYQAVELPYDGHDLSMVVVLPAADVFESFEQSLSVDQIASIIEDLDYQQVTLTMPRFEYESSFSLKETLEALGMRAAFSGEADFSGMTGDRSLFISEILHKAFVSVDEEGTEAAAATAVVMTESAAPGQPVEVTIDHPFIFLIRDIETGTILFVGRVVDPSV